MIIMTDRMKFRATDAAKAVNQLMRLDSRDSEALLEVLEEYFHPPRGQDSDSDLDSDVRKIQPLHPLPSVLTPLKWIQCQPQRSPPHQWMKVHYSNRKHP